MRPAPLTKKQSRERGRVGSNAFDEFLVDFPAIDEIDRTLIADRSSEQGERPKILSISTIRANRRLHLDHRVVARHVAGTMHDQIGFVSEHQSESAAGMP